MTATMRDVALKCEVSSGAVSQVLRNPNHKRFSETTRKKILKTAKELNYRPNRISQALRQKRSNIIGLVLPWNTPELMDQIEASARSKGFRVFVQFTANPETGTEIQALEALMDWNTDGIIWLPYGPTENYRSVLELFSKSKANIVILQRFFPEYNFDFIDTDYFKAMRKCILHFQEQKYEKIYFLHGDPNFIPRVNYKKKFTNLCSSLDIAHEVVELNSNRENRKKQLREFIKSVDGSNPPGVLCCTDWFGPELFEAAKDENLSSPENIGIAIMGDWLVGGNFRISQLTTPKLTALQQNCKKQAEMAVELLVKRINSKTEIETQHITLPMKFVPNQSTIRIEKN